MTLAATPDTSALSNADDIALADRLKAGHDQIVSELHKLIVGQENVIELALLSLFAGGNSLLLVTPSGTGEFFCVAQSTGQQDRGR